MLVILYGSQTGTAKGYAERVAYFGRRKFGVVSTIVDLKDVYDRSSLNSLLQSFEDSTQAVFVFVVATYGFGDATENATPFRNWIEREAKESSPSMFQGWKGARYCVLGLGDSCYVDFAAMGEFTDKCLSQLGALRLLDLVKVDADESLEEREKVFNGWKNSLFESLPPFSIVNTLNSSNLDEVNIEFVDHTSDSQTTIKEKEHKYPVCSCKRICPDTIEIVIDIQKGTPSLTYLPGSTALVVPQNSPVAVQKVAKLLRIDLDQMILFSTNNKDTGQVAPSSSPCTLGTLLTEKYDLNAQPTFYFLEEMLILFHELKSGAASSAFSTTLEAVSSVKEFSMSQLGTLLQLLPRIQPRSYTIASSPACDPGKIRLCIKLEKDINLERDGRSVHGLASSYFESIFEKYEVGERPEVSLSIVGSPLSRKIPHMIESAPIVIIAGGTGIAAARTILEHRRSIGMTDHSVMIFLGFKNENSFLYREEFDDTVLDSENVEIYVAYSRPDRKSGFKKQYVQNLLDQQKNELRNIIEKSASLVICGSKRLCSGTSSKLKEIVGVDTYERLKQERRLVTEKFA